MSKEYVFEVVVNERRYYRICADSEAEADEIARDVFFKGRTNRRVPLQRVARRWNNWDLWKLEEASDE